MPEVPGVKLEDIVSDLLTDGESLREYSRRLDLPSLKEIASRVTRAGEDLNKVYEGIRDRQNQFSIGVQAPLKTNPETIQSLVFSHLSRVFKADIEIKLIKNDNISQNQKVMSFELITPYHVERNALFSEVMNSIQRFQGTEVIGIAERIG